MVANRALKISHYMAAGSPRFAQAAMSLAMKKQAAKKARSDRFNHYSWIVQNKGMKPDVAAHLMSIAAIDDDADRRDAMEEMDHENTKQAYMQLRPHDPAFAEIMAGLGPVLTSGGMDSLEHFVTLYDKSAERAAMDDRKSLEPAAIEELTQQKLAQYPEAQPARMKAWATEAIQRGGFDPHTGRFQPKGEDLPTMNISGRTQATALTQDRELKALELDLKDAEDELESKQEIYKTVPTEANKAEIVAARAAIKAARGEIKKRLRSSDQPPAAPATQPAAAAPSAAPASPQPTTAAFTDEQVRRAMAAGAKTPDEVTRFLQQNP